MTDATCYSPACDKAAQKSGWCHGHYKRFLTGQPLDTPIRAKRKPGESPADCSFPDCGRPVKYKQLCKTHYECQRMNLPLVPIRDLMPRTACSAPACDRPVLARGLCGTHYARERNGLPLDVPIRQLQPRREAPEPRTPRPLRLLECTVSNCDRPVKSRGLCNAHYARQYYGVPQDQPIRPRRLATDPEAVCIVPGCPKLAKGGFGWCKTHWAAQTGKGTEYSARRRSRKFDGPHERITAADLRALFAATADCYLCGKELADPIEFDHVIPLARQGRHVLANIRPTHRHCNRVKWAALPPEVVAAEVGEGGDTDIYAVCSAVSDGRSASSAHVQHAG